MEKRVTYFVSRKHVLTWLAVLLLACSVFGRIAYFCGEKGAESSTMWLGLILPLAACLLYGITVVVGGKEHLYRSAIPFMLMCVYYAWNVAVAMPSAWFQILFWVLFLVIAVIYNVTFVGKIHHNWMLILILLCLVGTQTYIPQQDHGFKLSDWSYKNLADITMTLAVLCTVFAMQPHLDGKYHPTWGDRTPDPHTASHFHGFALCPA